MDNNPVNQKGKIEVAPNANNDQLGENASDEYARKYDNKDQKLSASSAAKNKNK